MAFELHEQSQEELTETETLDQKRISWWDRLSSAFEIREINKNLPSHDTSMLTFWKTFANF